MEIILLEDTRNLGKRGERMRVKPGFARNYLIPQGIALEATSGNVAFFEHKRKKIDANHAKQVAEAQAIANRIGELQIEIAKRVGEKQTLYGSVTTTEIAERLSKKGITVNRRRIELPDGVAGIKSLGDFAIKVDLHPEVVAELAVSVVAEE